MSCQSGPNLKHIAYAPMAFAYNCLLANSGDAHASTARCANHVRGRLTPICARARSCSALD
eukprot:scaffold18552_cov39-Prasinocladus_malaysianus.AAC.2